VIYFAKPGLIQGLYIVQKEEFSITCFMCDMYRPILSSERMLHKDYDREVSVVKKKQKKSLDVSLKGLDATMN
jgi:hypothetical protein